VVHFYVVRFQVLTEAKMKIETFCDVVPCSLGVDRRFRGAYCNLSARAMERPVAVGVV
jgi:hypothetical protein